MTGRIDDFTSSQVYRLMKNARNKVDPGEPFHTYIQEKVYEHRAGRQLTTEEAGKAVKWGDYMEQLAFNFLPLDYKLESKVRYRHPTIDNWSGAADTTRPEMVSDIKCPYTLKAFCKLDRLAAEGLEAFKKEQPDYYWQLVSNSILTDRPWAELIYFMPYKEHLIKIKEDLADIEEGEQRKYIWIYYADMDDLPYLIEGKGYKTINRFPFLVPEEDKKALTDRVRLASAIFKGEISKYE